MQKPNQVRNWPDSTGLAAVSVHFGAFQENYSTKTVQLFGLGLWQGIVMNIWANNVHDNGR
jgi:hypothetical protein